MSLFQCEQCGARENTACCGYWQACLNKTPKICSACETGRWHGKFEKVMLPKGLFQTNSVGNLEHIESGDADVIKWAIEQPVSEELEQDIVQVKTLEQFLQIYGNTSKPFESALLVKSTLYGVVRVAPKNSI